MIKLVKGPILHSSFEGTCTKKQEAKWKTLYLECGDLVAKLDKNPEVLRNWLDSAR